MSTRSSTTHLLQHIPTMHRQKLADEARGWISDCAWRNMEPEDAYWLTDLEAFGCVDRHYDGGLPAFVAACGLDADDQDQPAPIDSMQIPDGYSGPKRVTRRFWNATHRDFKVSAAESLRGHDMMMLRSGEQVALYIVEIVG